MKKVLFLIVCFLLVSPLKAGAGEPIKKGQLLDLGRSIEIALKYHPSIVAAKNTVRANETRIGQAKSNYYPQVSVQSSYSKNAPAVSTKTGISGSGTYDQYAADVNLTQNIYDFERTATQVKIANLNTDSSRQDLDNVTSLIVLGVKQSYYTLVAAIKSRDVAVETVQQFKQHLEQAKGFFEVGIKPKFDVTKAEVDLSNAKLYLIRAENAVRIARVNLNNAIGVSDMPEYIVESDILYEKYETGFEEALNKAYENRPDLRSLILKEESANQAIELAKTGNYPSITGNAGYGFGGTDFPLDKGWNIGATLNIPVFSGFLVKNQIAEAKANLDVLKANEESLRQQIRLDVEQAYSNLLEASDRISTTQLTVRQADENLELANGRYAAGVGNPIEVTDALVAVNNAKTAHISALTDYKTAQASLEKAMGIK